jgi:deoxyribonuclease (pyrimidine dimer)
MTRINSGISVKRLTDEHLLAEHREIKRLPACLKKSIDSGKPINIPQTFRLGKGHVKFFFDKMLFIKKRYKEIYEECLARGFTLTDFSSNFDTVPLQYLNDYTPTKEETVLLEKRIKERFFSSKKKQWHYRKTKTHEPLRPCV